jgi:ATP-dependent helicase/nuclease subunit B
MRVSATQIETYHQCRFRYFCRYGMNIEERRMAKLDALEYGSLMHYLLEHLFREIGAQKILKLGQRELRKNVDQQLLSYAQEKLGGTETQTARFSWLLQRVAEAACVVIWHIAEELSQSRFSPTDFELPVGQSDIPGLKISLSDGGSVEVDGKIDRVDADEIDGNTYLRVVDYKTGKKMFRLSDILGGTNLQMLIYLAALCENGGSHWKNPKPAGILYMPADRPAFTASRKTDDETIQKDQNKKLRMNGLLLDDPGILSDMEEDGKGTYIPAALKNGASTAKSSVVSSRDFELILQSIRKMVKEMAEELHRGNVGAQPLKDRDTACKWCPYGAVCMTEEGMPVRETKSNVSVTETVEILRRGESDGT